MTTQVFFENATQFNFRLFDRDGNSFGRLFSNGYYSLKLNYSPTFLKEYVFYDDQNQTFTMWMNIDGTIAQIYPNNQIHLEVDPEEYTARIQLFPPPLKTSRQVTNHGRLNGRARNKLLITPINNVFARITPLVAPPVCDYSLRLDFV